MLRQIDLRPLLVEIGEEIAEVEGLTFTEVVNQALAAGYRSEFGIDPDDYGSDLVEDDDTDFLDEPDSDEQEYDEESDEDDDLDE